MASVEERVKQIIVEQLGVDEAEVTPTASFVDDLGADSLDQVELVMAELSSRVLDWSARWASARRKAGRTFSPESAVSPPSPALMPLASTAASLAK